MLGVASTTPLANGVALMRERKFAAARVVLIPALLDTPLPLGYCLLGEAEVALHDDEAARSAYMQAIELAGEGAADGAAAVGVARADARLGRHRCASRRLRRAVSRRTTGLAQHTAAAAALEAAEASVRADDCGVAIRWLGAILRCGSQRVTLDERERSDAGALLVLLRLRRGDLDEVAASDALAACTDASLLARFAARQLPGRGIGGGGAGGGISRVADAEEEGWAAAVARDEEQAEDFFLERVALNACSLHSPAWSALDDKLGLHRALGRHRARGAAVPRWPTSFEMPREREALEAFEASEVAEAEAAGSSSIQWVLKSARGYGGGSVRFLPSARDVPPAACGLAQRYVAPPLLVKGGRRVTLRAYVVVLTGAHGRRRAFLSRDGLVRFAARVYDGNAEDAAQHLTNGAQAALAAVGEGGAFCQGVNDFADEPLEWLEGALGGDLFARVTWPRVVDAATTLVALAAEEEPSEPLWPHAVLPLALPKIVGLDFSLDAGGVPFLLELNRTPGLSPRSSADSATKRAVVEAAWDRSLWQGDEEAPSALRLIEL